MPHFGLLTALLSENLKMNDQKHFGFSEEENSTVMVSFKNRLITHKYWCYQDVRAGTHSAPTIV